MCGLLFHFIFPGAEIWSVAAAVWTLSGNWSGEPPERGGTGYKCYQDAWRAAGSERDAASWNCRCVQGSHRPGTTATGIPTAANGPREPGTHRRTVGPAECGNPADSSAQEAPSVRTDAVASLHPCGIGNARRRHLRHADDARTDRVCWGVGRWRRLRHNS